MPAMRVPLPGSIPAVVPHLNHAVFNAHGESGGRFVRRRGQRGAGPDAKPRAVARTDDFSAFDAAAGQLPAVMRADVFDRIVAAVEIEHRDLRAVDINAFPLSGRKLAGPRNSDPVTHSNRNDFDIRLDRLHQVLDAGKRARYRAPAAAATPPAMH